MENLIVEFKKDYDIVYLTCLEAAEQLDYEIQKENISTGIITYSTKMSFWSWSETFTIHIINTGNSLIKVKIESEADYQIYDWGKSEKNIQQFVQKIKELLK